MIIELNPISMSEANELVGSDKEELKGLKDYFGEFSKLKKDKALKLKDALVALDNPKLKLSHIIKMVDFLPRDSESVHKIVNDVSLNEEEVSSILDVIKDY